MKCQHCDRPAVVHEVLIKNDKRTEVHLCEVHAAQAGYPVTLHQSLNPVLSQLVSTASAMIAKGGQSAARTGTSCRTCGLTISDFRSTGVLGCPGCYDAFEKQLSPLIERAHAGAISHIGKVPRRGGGAHDVQLLRQRLVRELDEAVAAEQYERAAELRDRLLTLPRGEAPAAGECPDSGST